MAEFEAMTALHRLLHRLGWHWWYWIGSIVNNNTGHETHYIRCHLCPASKEIRVPEGTDAFAEMMKGG